MKCLLVSLFGGRVVKEGVDPFFAWIFRCPAYQPGIRRVRLRQFSSVSRCCQQKPQRGVGLALRSYPFHTSPMKAAVSIPDPVFEAADKLAQRMGVSRSRLYSVAIERFVQDHDDEAITAKLNEVYATESSALDPVLQSIQSRSVK
jgi:predicted transcriptional regulator